MCHPKFFARARGGGGLRHPGVRLSQAQKVPIQSHSRPPFSFIRYAEDFQKLTYIWKWEVEQTAGLGPEAGGVKRGSKRHGPRRVGLRHVHCRAPFSHSGTMIVSVRHVQSWLLF